MKDSKRRIKDVFKQYSPIDKRKAASKVLYEIMQHDLDERNEELSVLANWCVEYVDGVASDDRLNRLWNAISAMGDIL